MHAQGAEPPPHTHMLQSLNISSFFLDVPKGCHLTPYDGPVT